MTHQQYTQYLIELENRIDEGKVEGVWEEIQRLEKYKPVRLQLDYLKVKYRLREPEKYNSIIGDIFAKYMLGFQYPYLDKVLEAICSAYEYRKSEINRRRYQYIRDALNGVGCHYEVMQECSANYLESQELNVERKWYLELYASFEILGMLIHWAYGEKQSRKDSLLNTIVQTLKGNNLDYFRDQLKKDESFPFVFFVEEHNELLIEILKKELNSINKTVFCIGNSLEYVDDTINIKDTIAASVQYCMEQNGVMFFTPIEIIRSNGSKESNVVYLLEYIKKKYAGGKCLNLLASGFKIDELSQQMLKGTFFSRMTDYRYEILEHTMVHAVYGNYLSYISNIYCEDCEELLNRDSTVRFSIVIPARNSGEFLRHTLQTCLEQHFQGDYEIVVSDNSTEGNADVYNLCQELNSEKIVYIKTPRELRLARSFEYACLHTRGEYVLTIGSDDGLLPWTLEILDAVTRTYPTEEIIQWERGFYAWPGFNEGQEHQFVIPDKYEKGKLHLYYKTKEYYLQQMIENPRTMYSLPMLYINSCFARKYMHKLLHTTGSLWDGICQDIYMGVITVATQDKILNMRYPLSIAGMSKGSVGAASCQSSKTNEEYYKMIQNVKKDNEMGGYNRTVLERSMVLTGTDTSSLYTSILRAIELGVLDAAEIESMWDWKPIFAILYSEMDVRDVAYDKLIHAMRYASMKQGEEFLLWFDKTIYKEALETIVVDDNKPKEVNRFNEEKLANGGTVLDASKYDVYNIYEATKLFERLTGL